MYFHLHVRDGDRTTALLWEIVSGGLYVIHCHVDLLADELLSKELTSLVHPWNVVQGSEVFRAGGQLTFFVGDSGKIIEN